MQGMLADSQGVVSAKTLSEVQPGSTSHVTFEHNSF